VTGEWADTELTTALWQVISSHSFKQFRQLIAQHPAAVHVRAKDGRGALFWAYEFKNGNAARMLCR
jgi:hypothetical protein